jgi:hypothetical protein
MSKKNPNRTPKKTPKRAGAKSKTQTQSKSKKQQDSTPKQPQGNSSPNQTPTPIIDITAPEVEADGKVKRKYDFRPRKSPSIPVENTNRT